MRKIFLIVLTFLSGAAMAQEPADALRYSMMGHGGSARTRAIGGAVVSLGGDITAAAVNPAGLAFFKTSEFVFTPTLGFNNTKINYLDNQSSNKKTAFDISNFGFILPKENAREAAIVNNLNVYGATHIREVIEFFNGDESHLEKFEIDTRAEFNNNIQNLDNDFADVKGQENMLALLFDMNKFELASQEYKLALESKQPSKNKDKAALNLLISSEKGLTSDELIAKKVGKTPGPRC